MCKKRNTKQMLYAFILIYLKLLLDSESRESIDEDI